jgi:hypothetical protein
VCTCTKIGVDLLAQRFEVGFESVEGAAELLVNVCEAALAEGKALDPNTFVYSVLIAKAADFDMHQFGEFARQILDVNTGSAVDIGRVFSRE